ncbi:TonB-dependent receptor [Antarcticibacterium arcticum]|uniref:TonB-dependent receptor n=1 Tax=Antarcticibacterium arcticum TaxID=2585771 RepID=A0A5B8YM68_9FLAO|nr:TonB-dependent receptor [Antarcticibacterium arcticum]QED37723.1 TonB-dependent receptor [Antarcticibacterium arcticum]
MKNIFIVFFLFFTATSFSQHTFTAQIKDAHTNENLFGANVLVAGTAIGATADENGVVTITNVPAGTQTLQFSFLGYETAEKKYNFPLENDTIIMVLLQPAGEEMEELFIAATRSRRTIADLPTRVEVISGEELEEKGNMKPGDIRMLLNETTGIQTQQTSATSYNSSIRIQGLDGKYTQLLKDGYPLYSGFSGGLSLLQIVPLDLQQVEVIKGASSTLHGAGAIAGLVNLVSKTPGEERELNFLLNATSALGLDLSGFYSNKYKKWGTTVFASYNLGSPYDPSDIGLTAIPEFRRYTVNPRLFYYFDENTTLNIGVNTTVEERTGGNIDFIENKGNVSNPYFEKNNTNRITTRAGFDKQLANGNLLSLKNSFSFFERSIEVPNYVFSGDQFASFSEASYSFGSTEMEWIAGLNLWVDKFTQAGEDTARPVDYNHLTYGAFLQNNWKASETFSLETGLRSDYQNEYGLFILPRISGLFSFSPNLTARLGGGLGYKTPTIFTEDAERIQFRNVLPINVAETNAERSIGGNFDINYRKELTEELDFTMNTLFFYTRVNDPLILMNTAINTLEYLQPEGYIDTRGIETNIKIGYRDFKLFTGYTLADVNQHYNRVKTPMPLVAKHRLNNVLMYELEDNLKIGLEAYYFGPQDLNDGSTGQQYWIFGLMTEKIWDNFSIFLNFENFTDTRQSRFDSIYTGSISNPQFRDIYAPVDGFVVNGGIKLKL